MITEIATVAGDLSVVAGQATEGTVTAAPAPDAQGVTGWIQNNIIPLVLTAVGVFALWKSKNGDVPFIVTMGAGVLVGFCILAMAMPGVREALTTWIAGFFGAA